MSCTIRKSILGQSWMGMQTYPNTSLLPMVSMLILKKHHTIETQ